MASPTLVPPLLLLPLPSAQCSSPAGWLAYGASASLLLAGHSLAVLASWRRLLLLLLANHARLAERAVGQRSHRHCAAHPQRRAQQAAAERGRGDGGQVR